MAQATIFFIIQIKCNLCEIKNKIIISLIVIMNFKNSNINKLK